MTNNLFIVLRGVPGSGKSTVARGVKKFCDERNIICKIFSTDDWFSQNGGFDPTKLSEAHEWNFNRTVEAFKENVSVVILDNTNIQRAHFQKYVVQAEKHSYLVEERIVGAFNIDDIELYYHRCTHNVPFGTIRRMAETFEL